MESNHARPPHQSGACPAGPSSVLVRERDSAERNPALGSPPSAGHIPEARRLRRRNCGIDRPALRVVISPGGFEPPSPTLAGWRSRPLSYGESSALDGSRTRLTRETAGPRNPGASESVCCHVACRPRLDAAVAAPKGDAFRDLRDRESARRILDLRQASRWSSGESNPARVVASHRSSPSEPRKSDRRGSNPVRSAGNAVCFRPDTTVARLATILLPSGFPGVALRSWKEGEQCWCTGPRLEWPQRGEGAAEPGSARREPSAAGEAGCPERESNPRRRCERPASCPARRPGREHGRKESNPLASVLETEWTPCLVRVELLGRDSNHASFGSEPKILPLDDRGTEAATAGVEPAFPG